MVAAGRVDHDAGDEIMAFEREDHFPDVKAVIGIIFFFGVDHSVGFPHILEVLGIAAQVAGMAADDFFGNRPEHSAQGRVDHSNTHLEIDHEESVWVIFPEQFPKCFFSRFLFHGGVLSVAMF